MPAAALPAMPRILIIGSGSFGQYITENVIRPLGFEIVAVLRSKDFDQIPHYAAHPELYDLIYIALPYELHNPVLRLFPASAPILCEKPILGYDTIPTILMGYHRIYDRHFINAKLDVQRRLASGGKPRIRIVSRDMGESTEDSLEWLYCAMCHDLHMAAWLLDDVAITGITLGKTGSDIVVELEGRGCRVTIEYARDSVTYVQEVVVDNVVYGYDSEVFSATFEETYRREFLEFAKQPKPDQSVERLQKKAADLLIAAARIMLKQKPELADIHRKKYTTGVFTTELSKKLLAGDQHIMPFEPIEQ